MASSDAGNDAKAVPPTQSPPPGPSTPAIAAHLNAVAAKLGDTNTSIDTLKVKLTTAHELRDGLELYAKDQDYRAFCETVLPVILKVLAEGDVNLQSGNVVHRIRHALLETVYRLPHSESLRGQASTILEALLRVLRVDNEDNAVIAMKICIDLHRSFKDSLHDSVDNFLGVVKDMYNNMRNAVDRTFPADAMATDEAATPGAASSGTPALGATTERASSNIELPLGMHSFKLLQECPIAIVFIFQSYRDVVAREINVFVPLIFDVRQLILSRSEAVLSGPQFLELQPAAQARAREEAAANGQLFIGLAPSIIPKRTQFGELLMAQVKTVSFLAYVIRVATGTLTMFKSTIPAVAIRMLMDIPQEATGTRRELLIATRHILATDFRSAFIPHLDSLLDERVLVGNGTTSCEALRPLSYSMIADLVHHVRSELTTAQLSRVVHTYSCNVHDATLPNGIQTMCCKLLLNIIENIVSKERDAAMAMLYRMLEAFERKIEGLAAIRKELHRWARPRDPARERGQNITEEYDEVDIERARPVGAVNNMIEMAPDPLKGINDARFLFRTIIVGIRTILGHLKMHNMPQPDAVLLGRLFRSGARCMSMYDGLRREDARRGDSSLKEIMDIYSGIFISTDLLVFQEVFENNIAFYVEEMLENHELLQITQHLLSEASVSQAFVGIIFRFLVSRLDQLGQMGKEYTTVILRIFKMACMAVTIFPETNEAVLQPHLCTFIMTSLRLASQAKEPTSYYLLMRTLFRSIGGGRFEILYKEVLPLLQTLLENLNGLINSADRSKRDLFIELCLTVPVRLSVLLPYLNYLMKPLVLALQGAPDLVAQGLRTLELCVDNLTHEFLSPVLAPFLHDVMAGLWRLLRPLPANHQHAHTTLRILGKLGGRNRRLLGPPKLEWRQAGEEADLQIHFEGRPAAIRLTPLVELANRMFRRHDPHYQKYAYLFLKHAAVSFLSRPTLATGEPEETLNAIIRGLFEASRVGEHTEEANQFILDLAHHVFAVELTREVPSDGTGKHAFPFSSCLVESLVENLASVDAEHLAKTADQTVEIVKSLLAFREVEGVLPDLPVLVLHQLANKLCSLCFDQSWYRKTGGATGIDLLSRRVNFGAGSRAWLIKHEADFVRALLFMLKDMPRDPPANVDDVAETLLHVLRVCNMREGDDVDAMEVDAERDDRHRKAEYLVGLLIIEVSSQVAMVRDTAKRALQILADAAGVPLTTLCLPVRDRLLTPIFTKPLRALAFPMQVGFIDAVTFCITLDPPLVEFDDPNARQQANAAAGASGQPNGDGGAPQPPPPQQNQPPADTPLSRLLTEALGIADADDQALTGRHSQHRQTALLINLRVVCVKLLSAAMNTPDFSQGRHYQMRTRILSVYFKLLYSRSKEVVDAVYQSLKGVLERQGKLPKELLQTGLRPVLMNLSDYKRLSVPSLTGLARLLELLTNYFKVEIGTKLLDHFKSLSSDLQALTHAALNPQNENGELAIMAAVVNIFRLLPHPAASQFLEGLVLLVVNVETQLKKDGATPFIKPLAGFLNRYPFEACDFYFPRLITDDHFARNFCAVLASDEAANLRGHITQHSRALLVPFFEQEAPPPPSPDGTVPPPPYKSALHAAQIMQVLIARDPSWIVSNSHMIEPMIQRWISARRRERRLSETQAHLDQLTEDDALLEVFIAYLRQAEHIDLIFHIVDIYTFRSPTDHATLSRFFVQSIIASRDIAFKQKILLRFMEIFDSPSVSQEHKTMALRMLINPILTMAASRAGKEDSLVDLAYANTLAAKIWAHAADDQTWRSTMIPTEAIKIELLHMLTILIRHWPELVSKHSKNVIRFAWASISDHDATVKHVGYVLTAYFLAKIESPAKICMLTYTGLLRSHAPEARALAREALDVLVPCMPTRMASAAAGGQPVDWLNSTRRIIADEGHNTVAILVHIYQTFVRHPDEYYVRREWFLPGIINSLPKFGLTNQSSLENRILAVDLVELIVKWERKRLEALRAEEAQRMDVDGSEETGRVSPKRIRPDRSGSAAPSTASSGPATAPGALAHPQKDSIASTLIRIINQSPEQSSATGTNLPSRALALLRELLGPEIWPDVAVKMTFFQRQLLGLDLTEPERPPPPQQPGQPVPPDPARLAYEASITTFCNTVESLSIAVQLRPDEWTTSNIGIIQAIVDKALTSTEARVHLAVRTLLERAFTMVAPPADEDERSAEAQTEAKSFYDWATNSVEAGLRQQQLPQQPNISQPPTVSALHGTLTLLNAWVKSSQAPIDFAIPSLVRVLTRLTKDHVNSTVPVPNEDPALKILVAVLELLRPRIIQLNEHRRWLLSALVQIVDKSTNIDLCRFVLETVRKWVTDKNEPFPNVKEKAGILHKMMAFEGRVGGDDLLRDYLQLILDIYSDPQLARSELTVRLESAFLLGCKNRDATIRGKFLQVFDESVSRELFQRLHYIIGVQSWEQLAESNWIHQALDLLLGAIDREDSIYRMAHGSSKAIDEAFVSQLVGYRMDGLVDAARKLLYADATVTHTVWTSTFSAGWSCLSRREQADMTRFVTALVSKDYHLKSLDRRPNNIQALLNGLLASSPLPTLPPHLVRYLGKTFGVWHTALELLSETAEEYRDDDEIRESTLDATAEMYGDLAEDDLFYGLWRRRCYYAETNVAISFEQNGMWQQAEHMYEAAQAKARNAVMPYTESEYALWEDHWVMCAQKLQQWDILTDLAKHEGNNELSLECAWRLTDWVAEREQIEQAIKGLNPAPTPRRRVYEAYMSLVRSRTSQGQNPEDKKNFERYLDDGMQLALRKWFYLPEIVSDSHVPLLQLFQQYVELQEAGQIFASLAMTTVANLDQRSQELKNVLMTWRERLPNLWDDINVWSDIVAWRQHVFSAINSAYMPLVPASGTGGAQAQSANSYAFRGFHEAAWIINRFAHVARKHELSEVCLSSLTKIYTLPNIEIQEAFLKLREQAKCHYQNPNELTQGLEVISNTNLSFFGPAQKAEFFTLKGMYLAKLGMHEEVSTVFNQALTMDMTYPKAWAEWGDYHDRRFREHPDLDIAAQAVNCYLQAAGLYKNSKVRKLLTRILWLLGLDDDRGSVSKAFDMYKGDVPVWYWITFIPQLLTSLSNREAKYARVILMKIAKAFPQSLYFLLRTQKEELAPQRLAYQRAQQQKREQQLAAEGSGEVNGDSSQTGTAQSPPRLPPPPGIVAPPPQLVAAMQQAAQQGQTAQQHMIGPNGQPMPGQPMTRPAWDHVDEIVAILKTAFPLLALSMETFCDQVTQRFKQSADEDIYRLVNALLYDAFMQYNASSTKPDDPGLPSQTTLSNVSRVADKLNQAQFYEDFVNQKPTLQVYIQRLQRWRDRYEAALDRKPRRMSLENSSHWLVEFPYHRFDEIEVPGQYLKLEDSNVNFVRIDHFQNKFDFTRSGGTCWRRITFVGNDGTLHPFSIQLPAPRHARREERIAQFFRMLNDPLGRRKETRKRNLTFNVPLTVPLAPSLRLVQNDASITALQDVWEQHCRDKGMGKDDPVIAFRERVHQIVCAQRERTDIPAAKLEAFDEVALKMFPDDILKKFMLRSMSTPSDLWHIRKQMTLQFGAFIFMTNVFCMTNRTPARIHFSRSNGGMHTSDMLPSLAAARPDFTNNEPIPFRFTPNLQKWFGVVGIEGVLTSSILAIARSLTDHEHDLEHRLSIFVREEVVAWHQIFRHPLDESRMSHLRDLSLHSVDEVVKRARLLSCKAEREKTPYGSVPANQTIIELLTHATNPTSLCMMEPTSQPWY